MAACFLSLSAMAVQCNMITKNIDPTQAQTICDQVANQCGFGNDQDNCKLNTAVTNHISFQYSCIDDSAAKEGEGDMMYQIKNIANPKQIVSCQCFEHGQYYCEKW